MVIVPEPEEIDRKIVPDQKEEKNRKILTDQKLLPGMRRRA